jgi:hypothetical protein
MLAVAPVPARAVLVMPLPARVADHAIYCAARPGAAKLESTAVMTRITPGGLLLACLLAACPWRADSGRTYAASGSVCAAHAAAALCGTLILIEAAPSAVLLRAPDCVVQAVKTDRAGLADRLSLPLANLAFWLAFPVGAEEEQQILTTARRGILPPPVGPGKHGRLPTYLRHGSITSTKLVK